MTDARDFLVAPLVGAWIETSVRDDIFELKTVAPLVGAWIETYKNRQPDGVL